MGQLEMIELNCIRRTKIFWKHMCVSENGPGSFCIGPFLFRLKSLSEMSLFLFDGLGAIF